MLQQQNATCWGKNFIFYILICVILLNELFSFILHVPTLEETILVNIKLKIKKCFTFKKLNIGIVASVRENPTALSHPQTSKDEKDPLLASRIYCIRRKCGSEYIGTTKRSINTRIS